VSPFIMFGENNIKPAVWGYFCKVVSKHCGNQLPVHRKHIQTLA
jgi:hypothetical protein